VSWVLNFLLVLSASKAEVDEGEEEEKVDMKELEVAIVAVAAVEHVCECPQTFVERLLIVVVTSEETIRIQK